jgi:hypothetical protein
MPFDGDRRSCQGVGPFRKWIVTRQGGDPLAGLRSAKPSRAAVPSGASAQGGMRRHHLLILQVADLGDQRLGMDRGHDPVAVFRLPGCSTVDDLDDGRTDAGAIGPPERGITIVEVRHPDLAEAGVDDRLRRHPTRPAIRCQMAMALANQP